MALAISSFPVPLSPWDVEPSIPSGPPGDHLEDLVHFSLLATMLPAPVFLVRRPFSASDLGGQPPVLKGLVDLQKEIRGVKRFGQVTVGPSLMACTALSMLPWP